MKTILITGINGFLGSHLAKRLSNDNLVIGLEYNTDDLFRLKDTEFKVYSSKYQELELLFKENIFDIIIHTATIYRQTNESIENLLKTNILLPIKLFELAQKYNVPYFINTDTFFNNPNTSYNYLGEYTLTKRHALEWLKMLQSGTKIINMKIFHMYGPGDSPSKFVTQIINDLIKNVPQIELTSGEQKRDFIYIEDIVDAYSLVIDNLKNQHSSFLEYEVGTGESHSIREFVTIAAGLINSNSKLLFGSLPYREGEMMVSEANNCELVKLGWVSKTNISDGCSKIIPIP